MGCLISSIVGLLIGFFLIVASTQPDYYEFNVTTFVRFSGIILVAICGIYLLIWFIREARVGSPALVDCPACGTVNSSNETACTHCHRPLIKQPPTPPVQPEQQELPPKPPQSYGRSGVFLP